MNKLIAVFLGIGLISSVSLAAGNVRGAKRATVINNSASAVLACRGASAVYSVILSSGATTDHASLRDSATAVTTGAEVVRIQHATTGNQTTFDPPLQFRNGVSFNVPATTVSAAITCETGVVTQGY